MQMRTRNLTMLMTVIWGVLATTAGAKTTWYVDANNCPGDGSLGNPYCLIQDAIDAAALSGHEISVAPGEYSENINFVGKAVRLFAPAGPDTTTIRGFGSGSVVVCISGEGINTVIEGFRIENGIALTRGGGMRIENSNPTVTNCYFASNFAPEGGGLSTFFSNPVISNCTFAFNNAERGGGVYNQSNTTNTSTPTYIDCIFKNNSAEEGGGMFNMISSPSLRNCAFFGNNADGDGGGDMYTSRSSPTLTNCVFSGNDATLNGGALYSITSDTRPNSPVLTNCTLATNTALSGGGLYNDTITPFLENCILSGNTPDQIVDFDTTTTVEYSDIQGGHSGIGNIDLDPVFGDVDGIDDIVGTEDDNLRPQFASPCIDAGDSVASGLTGVTQDFDAQPRFLNVAVDMGAYESDHCPADTDSNGAVDIDEFLRVLADWGACAAFCPADTDGDGTVGITDFLRVLADWGPCP